MAGRLSRYRLRGSVAPLVLSASCCTAIALISAPASAQVVSPGPNATLSGSPVTLTGTIDGGNGPGFFVANGGTLTVNNGSLQNFTTTGGAGSGGGLGAGGAIFIDVGGVAIINNTSFSHDTAIGGTAINSQYGGTLNNGVANNYFQATSNGSNGANGIIFPDNVFFFGDGYGDGVTGINVGNGGNATSGFGGAGGIGGPGTNGWGSNPVAQETLTLANLGVATSTISLVKDSADAIIDAASAAGDAADSAQPFEDPLAPTDAAENVAKVITTVIGIANDAVSLAGAVVGQIEAQQALNAWTDSLNSGAHGYGGTGENGGNGGAGSYGFGGGPGGLGGAFGYGGASTANDGTGGSGGTGGAGGFGGGGGAGGAGYSATDSGGAGPPGQVVTPYLSSPWDQEATGDGGNGTSSSGSGGAGGAGGFGAGVGCTGGVGATAACTGGGGGDGYGGAIFVSDAAALTITGTSTFSGNEAEGGTSATGGAAGGSAGTDLFMMTGSTVILAPGAGNVITFNGTIADDSIASLGTPSTSGTSSYPIGSGAGLTVYAGTTIFKGENTYSGQTVINGGQCVVDATTGACTQTLNTASNTAGTPNYGLTDGALQVTMLQVQNGSSTLSVPTLPNTSALVFAGPGLFTGGVLQTSGTFTRWVSTNPNSPTGSANGIQWTGSGGFAAINAPLTVTLGSSSTVNGQLVWGQNGFVPFGDSLIFGSATSNYMTTLTNPMDISCPGGSPCTNPASILVGYNGNTAGSTATMSGIISGNGDLSIGGGGFNGTLILTAQNTYTGATTINSGTLSLGGTGSIGSSSGVTVGTGAFFDISGTTSGAGVATLSGTGTVSLGGQELTISQTSSFAGTLADGGANGGTSGSLIVGDGIDSMTLTLTGTNTYTGDTTITPNATLALAGTGSIADSTPVIDNGTFDISQSTIGGAMITTLTGSGTVALGSNLLDITAGAAGATGTNTNGVFSGVIEDGPSIGGGSGGMLTVSGGQQTLSGTNTYTGGTVIDGGATLALQGTGSIATSQYVDVDDNGTGGTFDISQTSAGASIQTLMGLNTGTVALGAQALTITNGASTFYGTITDGGMNGGMAGSLIVTGGTQTLAGTNTYTGATTIAPASTTATLALTGSGSIADSSEVAIATGGTFDISQTTSGASIKTLADTAVGQQGTVDLGSKKLTITAGSTTFSGTIADGGIGTGTGGSLEIAGGVQTLEGTNTYTGATTIDSGATLALAHNATLATNGSIAMSSGVTVASTGTFDISQTQSGASIMTLAGAGNVALGGSSQTLNITAGSTTFSGVMADGGIGGGTGGNFEVSGGTQTLSGINTYTGTTTVDPGATLTLTGNGAIATSSQVTDNGTVDISGTNFGAWFKTLAGTNSAALLNLGSEPLTITAGTGSSFAGNINGSGAVNIAGGTQTLSGTNAYTGLTTINQSATLALSGVGSITQSSGVLDNGTFDISQSTIGGAMITTLAGSGMVSLGSNLLNITAGAAGTDGTNPAGIFSGVIADGGLGGGTAGMVTISGGHQELTGANTYTGGTMVTGGATLSINNSNSLGAATSPLVMNTGTLVVDAPITIPQPITFVTGTAANTIDLNSNSITLSGALNGPGGFTAINGGTLNLTGTTNNLGGITLGTGTNLLTTASANNPTGGTSGLVTTPIVVTSSTGVMTQVFTGTVHVVGPLDITNGSTPELIILPGDSLVGNGTVNIMTVVQTQGTNAPGDAPAPIVAVNSPIIHNAGSTFTVTIDGPVTSYNNCPFISNPNGCAGQYSAEVVTGAGYTYTAGGTLAVSMTDWGAPGPLPSNYIPPVTSSFIIVQAQGGVLGSFANLTQPALGVSGSSGGLPPGTRLDALYYNTGSTTAITANAASSPTGSAANYAGNPNAIALWVTPASYTDLSTWNTTLNQNQYQVGLGLNALRGPAGEKNDPQATWDFGYLFAQQPQNLPALFDTLSGEVNADAEAVSYQMSSEFLRLMLDPAARSLGDNRDTGGVGPMAFDSDGPGSLTPTDIAVSNLAGADYAQAATPAASTLAYDSAMPAHRGWDSFDRRWSAWGGAFGDASFTNGDQAVVGSHNFSTSVYGFAAGMDYRATPGSSLGFALAGSGSSWTITQEALGSGHSDAFLAGLYGRAHFGGGGYFAAALSIANQWMSTDRNALKVDHLTSTFDAQTFGARGEVGYGVAYKSIKVTPYAAVQGLVYHSPNYGETDSGVGGFGLNFASVTETDLSSELGGRVDTIVPVGHMLLILRARGAWEHQWLTDPALTATFQAGVASGSLPGADTGFVVNGAALPQNLALVSAGADLHVTPKVSLSAKFDGQLATSSQIYAGSATVRYGW